MKAVLLARVSTKDQIDGYSLDAQVDRLENYIREKPDLDLADDARFIFDESARKSSRKKFEEVLKYLRNNSKHEPIAVCSDKVDRLIRNFAQRIHTIYDFVEAGKIELHFVSDNMVITKDSTATENFMLNIAVSLAQYYSDASSDNIRRGYERMVAEGKWFGNSPFGYKNVNDPTTGRRTNIVPDPEHAFYVRELFAKYATGNWSLSSLSQWLEKENVKSKRGYLLRPQSIQKILKNTFYYGEANSAKYGRFEHVYEPLIARQLFDQVAALRRKRDTNPVKSRTKCKYLFQGLIRCRDCGCSYTPEIKKGKYVYYSCTNAKGICERQYVSEQTLLTVVTNALSGICVPKVTARAIVQHLKERHRHDSRYSKDATYRLKLEQARLQDKIDLAADKLFDGKVAQNVYDRRVSSYRMRMSEIQDQLEAVIRLEDFQEPTIAHVFDLARSAVAIFDRSETPEKRKIIQALFQNFSASGKKPYFDLHEVYHEVSKIPDHPYWCSEVDTLRTNGVESCSSSNSVCKLREFFKDTNWQEIRAVIEKEYPEFLYEQQQSHA